MDVFRITGGARLSGRVRVGSAKNAVLPILAAALLAGGPVTIEDFPALTDTKNMLSILSALGCETRMETGSALIDPRVACVCEMPGALSKKIRSSIFLMGPMLARFGRAVFTYPGGCEIGLRPIDLHLKGLRALGAKIEETCGMIYLSAEKLRGGEVCLDFPSVGATENVMMAAVLAEGLTRIHNPAREPEILDLERFLNAMGARVRGAGSGLIEIEGTAELGGCRYKPMPDRIAAATYMAAAAMTGGRVVLIGARPCDMGTVLEKLSCAGCEVAIRPEGIEVAGPERLLPIEISTQPFPGFPTDMQAQAMALCAVADGASVIVENVFERRFAHAAELRRMGADIRVHGRTALVRGGKLVGARVRACDLRGGAALVLAGLAAQGVTEVEGAELIDRGYERMETALRALGAKIERL